jgi:hypothetical protein
MSQWPHASPAADLTDDPAIPLLTDRIYLPAVELDTALPASLAGAPAAEPATEIADEAAQAPPTEEPTASIVPAPGKTEPTEEAASVDAEAAIDVELDRDPVAASDADFEALLSAEQPLGGGDAHAEAGAIAAYELPPAASPIDDTAAEAATRPAAAAVDEAAIEAQGAALRAAVLQRLAARLPDQVNAAVRDLIQPAIDQAMAKLGEEAEVALRITLQELVEQALREELGGRKSGDAPH